MAVLASLPFCMRRGDKVKVALAGKGESEAGFAGSGGTVKERTLVDIGPRDFPEPVFLQIPVKFSRPSASRSETLVRVER